MLNLLAALVILYFGLTGDLAWYWWAIGVLAFAASLTPEGYLGPSIWRYWKHRGRRQISRDDDPRTLTGTDFEAWTADHMRREGYDAEVVGGPGDQGCDVLAERQGRTIAVQAKRISGTVETSAVQEAIAGREAQGANEGWLVTTASKVTDQARDLARKTGIKIHEV